MITWTSDDNCPFGFECVIGADQIERPVGHIAYNILKTTPVVFIVKKLVPGFWGDARTSVDDARRGLNSLALVEPTFFHAHILMPHAPITADKDCKKIEPIPSGSPNMRKPYVEFLQCVNSQVERFIDSILKKDPDALISIQSDHGYQQGKQGEGGWTLDKLNERYSILNAWRLPHACRQWFSSTMLPVNTFPLIFSCLSGQKQKFLPDRAFLKFPGEDNDRLIRKDRKWSNFTRSTLLPK